MVIKNKYKITSYKNNKKQKTAGFALKELIV